MNKIKFFLGLLVFRPRVLMFIVKSFFTKDSNEDLIVQQKADLLGAISYAKKHVPFYKSYFPESITSPDDAYKKLESLPIATKAEIKAAGELIYSNDKSVRYMDISTGGSTGEPLKFRIDLESRDIAFAILLRGWKYSGYIFGDKVATLAGGSLVKNEKQTIKSHLVHKLFNFKKYSSYGMSEGDLRNVLTSLNGWQPKIIRGYASAIYMFADYLRVQGLHVNFRLKSVITTSETLLPQHRQTIEKVFDCKVYDSYGLNDGGLTAFECQMHDGYHLDTERGLLEVVDSDGRRILDVPGRIVATTLKEKSMPLFRYETGDLGVLSSIQCSCGSKYPLLKSIEGRQTDFLEINGKKIGSPVLTVLMGKTSFSQYQIVQKTKCQVIFRVKAESKSLDYDEKLVRSSMYSMVGEFEVLFEYIDNFPVTKNGKHKFIINECN